MLACRDFHGAAAGVRFQGNIRVAGGQRVQHGEVHAFPAPALASHAVQIRTPGLPPGIDGRVAVEQRRGQPAYVYVFQQGYGAARVIEVAVGNDHAVELADAARTQIRHDDPAGAIGVEAVGGSRVVQQAVSVRFHQHGHALAHVKGRDPHLARWRAGRQGRQQRQPAQHARPAMRPAAWRQQPCRAKQCPAKTPDWRRGRRPHGKAARPQPVQHLRQHLHDGVCQQQ